MGRGIRLNDIKKLRCRFAPGCAPHRACRERIPRTVRYTPIRSPKSVPDTVSRSREFQVPIQPRARVETVQERPESCNIPTVDVFQQNGSENGFARLVVSNHCGPPSISHHLAVLDRFKNTCVNTARYGRNLSSVIGRSRTRFPVAW